MTLIEERTIALAGVLQACSQVQSLARKGQSDEQVYGASIKSILVLDAVNTPAVYAGLDGVTPGLTLLSQSLMSSAKLDDVELLRYVTSILHLQSQLYRDRAAYRAFAVEVERLSGVSKDSLVMACSDIYQKNISNLRPQVIVQGEQDFLQRDDVPSMIRAMLLAAFRSAVLWQQKGGTKFKLIWERTRMRNAASNILAGKPR